MHIAELKDIKETNMMKEIEWKLEEQNKNINTMNNGVMEMEEEMKDIKLMVMDKIRTRHLKCGFSKISVEGRHLKRSQLSQDKT